MLHTNSSVIPNNSTIHLTDLQIKYLALRAEGKTRKESARLAGYSADGGAVNPTKIEQSANLRKALMMAMEAKGLTTDKIAEKIAQGVDKKKVVFGTYKGSIVDEREVDDNEAQHKWATTALNIRGDLQEVGTQVNIGIIEVPRQKSVEDWNAE